MTDADRRARRLQRAELAMRALGKHGNPKKAAKELGIGESTLRKWVGEYCELKGYESPVHAAYWIDRPQSLHRSVSATKTAPPVARP